MGQGGKQFSFQHSRENTFEKETWYFNKSFIQHSDTLTDKQTGIKRYYIRSKNALNSQNYLYNHNQEITCMFFILRIPKIEKADDLII